VTTPTLPESHAVRQRSPFWPARHPTELAVPACTIWDNLVVSAARFPDKPAFIFLGRTLSYRELLQQAELLAGWLHGAGVRHGSRVVIFMQNCPQWVIGFHAAMRLGAVVVPVNPMNQVAELKYVFEDAGVSAAICSAELAATVAAARSTVTCSSTMPVVVASYSGALPDDPAAIEPTVPTVMRDWLLADFPLPASFVSWCDAMRSEANVPVVTTVPDNLAVLPYTSGTTAMPKGCMHSHKTLMPNVVGIGQWGHTSAESVWLGVAPLFHITGMMGSMLTPIFGGGTVVLMPRWNRELAGALIGRHRVTEWILIPTMLIDLLGSPNAERFDLSSLRFVNGGGAPMPEAVAKELKARLGLELVEGYGLTETAAPTHCNPVDRVKPQCLGIPVFGTEARVIDVDTGLEVPTGETGEIVVRGPQLFLGYWKQPQATEAAFIKLDGRRFFRTGDLGRRDEDGYFFLSDRLKRMINASGFKVWPSEVELMLFSHPAVQEACVIAAIDPYRGETVKAVIVPRTGMQPSADEIIAWARTQMSTYKVPRIVEFVTALPKSGSGKVMWRSLQDAERP